jgi:hypothetical protein
MNEAEFLQALRASSDARRILEDDFDFLPVTSSTPSSLFQFRNATSYEPVGADAAGGEFVLCECGTRPTRPLLYASSEGQAGIIAPSLQDGISIIVDLPYWHDCLKFSGRGQLAEMQRVVPLAESDLLADRPQIASSRQDLRALLGLSQLPDPVRMLHAAVTELSPHYAVSGPDGWPFESLFNTFTVSSNPEWRRRLEELQP